MSRGNYEPPATPVNKQHEKTALEKGMPEAVNEERLVLGSLLLDDSSYETVSSILTTGHFALEKHRTIYQAIVDIKEGGDRVDRVMVANLLLSRNKLDSVDGLSYLMALDEGLPKLPNISGYVRIIREKADLRMLISAGQAMMNSALLGTDSPSAIAELATSRVLDISSKMVTRKNSHSFSDSVEESGGLDEFLAPRKDGVPTGYKNLDELIYGLEPGLLYIIGGDSGHGKSSFAGNIAANIAFGCSDSSEEWKNKASPVGVFSLEMSKKALFTRTLCSRAKVSSFRLKRGFMQADERKRMNFAAAELASAPFYIDDTKGIGANELRKRVRRMKQEFGVKTVFVDYLQKMAWEADGKRSEYEGLTYITGTAAQCAAEEGVAMVLLSQFNQEYSRRKDKATRPTENALHGSGSIKKDADVIMLLFKLSQAHPGVAEQANRTECIIPKQRDGRNGIVLLDWQGKWTTFTEAAQELQQGRDDE